MIEVMSQNLSGGTEEDRKKSLMIAGVLAEIGTELLSNTVTRVFRRHVKLSHTNF
jgi:hypothetical protein